MRRPAWPGMPGAALLVVATLALASLGACSTPAPDEERIRQRLDDMAAGLADRSTRGVLGQRRRPLTAA